LHFTDENLEIYVDTEEKNNDQQDVYEDSMWLSMCEKFLINKFFTISNFIS